MQVDKQPQAFAEKREAQKTKERKLFFLLTLAVVILGLLDKAGVFQLIW